ncbi:MAG: TonB-dependent receptor [Bacteroidales bacterium]|nr:TonB-dependent receptor [Bacteroidales bacterium]
MMRRIIITLSTLFAGMACVFAQNGLVNINGKVLDSSGEPVPGVGIMEKGSSRGAGTAMDGVFSFSVTKGAILVFSALGYEEREIPETQLHDASVILNESSQFLEETVVVGYGVQKKVNLTGAVSSINMDEMLEGRPVTNLSSGLAGLSAGLYVNQNSGRPNADGATLLIRGRGTLNSSAPLVIIDGIEGDLSTVNPQDVQSISVLKDAASSSIYGSRAAGGVVLVTTKSGKEGKFSVQYNGYVSLSRPSNLLETINNYADYMTYYNEALHNTDPTAKQQYSDEMISLWRTNEGNPLYPNTDWTKEVFQTGLANNHNLSFSAGTDRISVYGSLGYMHNPGIIENSSYTRYVARLNARARVTDYLTLGVNTSGKVGTAEMGSSEMKSLFSAVGMPGMIYRSDDGRYGGIENPEENAQTMSPLYVFNQKKGSIDDSTVNTRFYASASLAEGLDIEASANYRQIVNRQNYHPEYEDLWSFRMNTVVYAKNGKDYAYNSNTNSSRLLTETILRYNHDFAGKLSLNAIAGISQEKAVQESFSAKRYNLLYSTVSVLDGATGDSETTGGKSEWVMRSYFGRLNLAWCDKYLFEANVRADGSSRFRTARRWGVFPSFSLGWRMDKEPFLRGADWLSQLKLRGSWGALGNNSVGNYEYQAVYNQDNYVLGNSVAPGLAILSISNADITWETTYVTDFGFDFAFLKSRLSGSFDWYVKDTRNILIDLPAPKLVGNAEIPTQNAARVRNNGFDLDLRWRDRAGSVNWYIGGNLAYVKNRVVTYKGDEATISGANMIKEGYPINVQYVLAVDRILQTEDDMLLVKEIQKNAPVDPLTGVKKNPFSAYGTPQLGDFLYKDLNGDGLIDENDRYAVGNGNISPWIFGIQAGLDWKGIDFSVILQGNAGYKVLWMDNFNMGYLNYGGPISSRLAEGAWRTGRTDAEAPRLLTRTNTINNQPSDYWVEDKSYVRLKNIQMGYTLPETLTLKAGISKARLYLSAENLLTITPYHGIDPEVGGTTYPTLKQFVFGLNLTF